MIGYKNTISGGSSILQPIRIPENTRNVILVMNLIGDLIKGNLRYVAYTILIVYGVRTCSHCLNEIDPHGMVI